MAGTWSLAMLVAERARPFAAVALPLIVVVVQATVLASMMRAHIWVLSFPAVFISSWIGTRRSAVLATILTTALAWWLLAPPPYVLVKASPEWLGAITLSVTGLMFCIFHERGRRANQGLRKAVDDGKAFEAFLAESSVRLARANEEITALNTKLTRLDALKARFFENVSQQLVTPLTPLLACVEKHLGAPGLDPELRRDLETADRSASTVLRYVNDLIEAGRLDAGQLTPEYSDTDAAALVRIAADQFSSLARDNGVEFIVDTPTALPVQTDCDRLQRILLNLLLHAFRFVPRGGRVRVSVREADQRFCLEVGDSGPAIPPDDREAVFEPFEQVERDGIGHRNGTGLELTIVKEFARLLGGTARVGDAPEGGALFVVDLPSSAPPGTTTRARAARTNGHAPGCDCSKADSAAGAFEAAPPRHEGRVLVIEGNRDVRWFITDGLRSEGFAVVSAADGREGYDRALADHPDLVVTDAMLPDARGEDIVRRLREHGAFVSTPFLMLTAKADEAQRVRLLRQGIRFHLEAPFSVAELRARVWDLVARKRAEDRATALHAQLDAAVQVSMQISEAVASLPEESVHTVLHAIAFHARNVTRAEFAFAGIGGDATHPFEAFACVGVTPEEAGHIGRPPSPCGVLGLASQKGKAVRLRDVRRHPAHRGFPAHHPEFTSFLGVPIRYRDRVVGSLFLAGKREAAEFSEQDEHVAEALAARAGIAIETARLYAAEGRAHAWLQAVLDQMPEGVILVDGNGRIQVRNQALRALEPPATPMVDRFGNAVAIDLRLPSGEPLAADDIPVVKAITEGKSTGTQEFVGRRSDDGPVPLLVSAAPIMTKDGTLGGAVMVLQDVSPLKELERLRREWTSIVAHDLRQPIGAITLNSSVLLRNAATAEQRRHLSQIMASAEHLSDMVSDLTDASLLDSHRMRLSLVRVDFAQLVGHVVQQIPAAVNRAVVQTPADRRLLVQGDPARLEQVVSNLVSNAIKYGTPQSEIVVQVRQAGPNAELRVTNRGPGIPADEVPTIFDRYVRSRETRHGTTKGLGLGLYIAKGLVEAHGGRIWVESVPGGLTTFHVVVPLDGPPEAADAASLELPGERREPQPEHQDA